MTTPPRKKNRLWIWFFAVVFTMALLATVVLIMFNLRQQLKPEQLAAARKMWQEHGTVPVLGTSTVGLMASPLGQAPVLAASAVLPGRTEHGPRDYTMTYATQVNHEKENHYWVKVRAGQVVESKFNGEPEDPKRFPYRSMDWLFDDIERFMKIDSAKDSPRSYVRAMFDDRKTGGLRWYVRSVMGKRERVEITLKTFTIDAPN